MTIEKVIGKDATIIFDAQKCVHSRGCVLSHPDVFVPNVKGEWIHPDAQPTEELMHIAKNCPSGAIRVIRNNKERGAESSDRVPLVNTLRVRENGPLAIEAELILRVEAQMVPRATLCRCGPSQNKPCCDISHVAAGIKATGEPAKSDFEHLAIRNGPIVVQTVHNSPLHVSDSLDLVSGTGATLL